MSLEPDDRVLIIPLGVKGTVLRKAAEPGFFVVQADNGGTPVSWLWRELAEIKPGHVTLDVEPGGKVTAAYVDGHRLPRSQSRGEQGWDA
jgi:prepilin-type processing-associated H-X9-DG protein